MVNKLLEHKNQKKTKQTKTYEQHHTNKKVRK